MSKRMDARSGANFRFSLSLKNDRPPGTFFHSLAYKAPYIAHKDELMNGKEKVIDMSQIDVSTYGTDLQDRELMVSIRQSRKPNSSSVQVRRCRRNLHDLEEQLDQIS